MERKTKKEKKSQTYYSKNKAIFGHVDRAG